MTYDDQPPAPRAQRHSRSDGDLPAVAPTIRSLATGGDGDLRAGEALASPNHLAEAVADLQRRFEDLSADGRRPRDDVELLITDVSAQRLALRAELLKLKRVAIIALAEEDDRTEGEQVEEILECYRAAAEQTTVLSSLLAVLRGRLG